MSDPIRPYRKLALANRLANARLHRACGHLEAEELTAPRPAFFGSIQATLNHILMVDRFYLTALEGLALNRAALEGARICPDLATLTRWQEHEDIRLLAQIDGLTPVTLSEVIAIDRGERVQRDRRDDVLMHLMTHQLHHRGQVHDMLSATGLAPPQLDEFIVGDDAAARKDDMLRLGWLEADLLR
jgi:uncharacterized damage-inducible protein DinB